MDSCKPLSQTVDSFAAMDGSNKLRSEPFIISSKKPISNNEIIADGFIGSLEIFVHQARDIHNICIYQNQDVYAKLCLTSDPEASVSTKTINGGGRYPVFNENLKLHVRSVDTSLKCEIWMLSRVKNYLEDQLLGFALVPLSQIVMNNGKLEKEFSLSSTDLFHSPAGFVSLTISYTGSAPELMAIASNAGDALLPDVANDNSISSEYANVEFPDLKVVSENKMMISEYFGIQCANTDCPNSDAEGKNVEISSTDNDRIAVESVNDDSPLSGGSADLPSVMNSAKPQVASEPSGVDESPTQKSKNTEVTDSDTSSSTDVPEKPYVLPIININIEPEQPVIQQEIVDMYMKSMQQFTESLAKMKLPMDMQNNSSGGGDDVGNGNDSTSDKKLQPSEKTSTPRVFYGSRAFF